MKIYCGNNATDHWVDKFVGKDVWIKVALGCMPIDQSYIKVHSKNGDMYQYCQLADWWVDDTITDDEQRQDRINYINYSIHYPKDIYIDVFYDLYTLITPVESYTDEDIFHMLGAEEWI